MWTILIWLLFLTLIAWVFYNARENINYERAQEHSRGRRSETGLRKYSPGEQVIANWLTRAGVKFDFDRPIAHSLREPPLRPDFVIADKHLLIDYYGISSGDVTLRERKEKYYRAAGWDVLSVTRGDVDRLDAVLPPVLGLVPAGKS